MNRISRSLAWIRRWMFAPEIRYLESEIKLHKEFSEDLQKRLNNQYYEKFDLEVSHERKDARISALQELIRIGFRP